MALITISLIALTLAQQNPLPNGCLSSPWPDAVECYEKNWWLGDKVDPCRPTEPIPIKGQQVYIQDPLNYCLMGPDPNNFILKNGVYASGRLPTMLQGEGHSQAFCVGDYLTPGAFHYKPGAIRSAHVITNMRKNGKRYIQIAGVYDCAAAEINCTSSVPGAYDDGGQYDSVPYVNCGKEPYSGVDTPKQGAGMVDYVLQAGAGIFCMRVCEAGLQQEDPCNVKDDTKGCYYTMNITTFNTPGFTSTNGATGVVTNFPNTLPPPSAGFVFPGTGPTGVSVSRGNAASTSVRASAASTASTNAPKPTVSGGAAVSAAVVAVSEFWVYLLSFLII